METSFSRDGIDSMIQLSWETLAMLLNQLNFEPSRAAPRLLWSYLITACFIGISCLVLNLMSTDQVAILPHYYVEKLDDFFVDPFLNLTPIVAYHFNFTTICKIRLETQ